jgi:hypothetical protein
MSASAEEIIEMPQPLGLYAGDLFDRGCEYLAVFAKIAPTYTEHAFASYYQFAHALELFLKSYLATKEVSKRALRGHPSHDLTRWLTMCKEHGLVTSADVDAMIEHVQKMNQHYDFRYPSGYNLSMPRPDDCLKVGREVVQTLEPVIARARLNGHLYFASETRMHRDKKVRWSD